MVIDPRFPDAVPDLPECPMYQDPAQYEVSYDGAYPGEIGFFEAMIRRPTGLASRVLELAAGSGRVSIPLALLGHEVTALDREPKMLRALEINARRAGVLVRAVQGDMRDPRVAGGDFDAVVSALGMSSIFPAQDEAVVHLSGIRDCLRPGGKAILVLPAATNPADVIPHRSTWDAARGDVATRSYFSYDQVPGAESGVVDYSYHVLAVQGGQRKLLAERGRLRVYSDAVLRHRLALVDGLELVAWHPMFDPATTLDAPPPRDAAAVAILERRAGDRALGRSHGA